MATNTIIGGHQSHGMYETSLGVATSPAFFIDGDDLQPTQYHVYLHTISNRAFSQPHPIYRNVIVPACPKDKRSVCFMKIAHPVQIPVADADKGGKTVIARDNAKRVALSICNPDYVGMDLGIQDKTYDDFYALSNGECNLNRQGVFASMNENPTDEECAKAEKRRENYYKFRLAEADGLERSNPRELQYILQQDHHMAADYFGIDANWHRAVRAKVECPNCGEKINAGIAYHYNNQRICIPDPTPAGWEKAWLAGAVKKEDVPEPMRWWRGPGRPPGSGKSTEEE